MTLSVHQRQNETKTGLSPMDYTSNLKQSLFAFISSKGSDIDGSLF